MFFAKRTFAQTKNIACFIFVFLFFVAGVLCALRNKNVRVMFCKPASNALLLL